MKRISRRNFLKAMGLAASMGVLAACGGGDTSSTAASTGTATSMADDFTGAGTSGDLVSGQCELVNIAASDPSDCQPFKTDKGTKSMFWMVYESLYDLDPVTGELCPVLVDGSRGAEGGYDIVDDLTYDFYLYDNIYDHAGNHVTASDVAFTYKTNIEQGYKSYYPKLEEAIAKDETTVELKLTAPITDVGELVPYLVNIWVYTEAAYNASPSQFAQDTCGTGPYMMTEFNSGASLTLEKNPNYWQTDASLINERHQQYVDKMVYNFMSEETQIVIGLESGAIDFCTKITAGSCSDFLEGGSYADKIGLDTLPDNKECCLLPNCSSVSLMSDENLRMACFYAIDNASVVKALGEGSAVARYTLGLSTGCSDYNPDWENRDNCMTNYDVEKAKEYLAKSSYNGEKLVLMTNTDDNGKYETVAVVIQAFLEAVGIKVELRIEEKATVDSLRTDPTNFDMEIGCPSYTSYVMELYKFIFNNTTTADGSTQWYVNDDKLFELYNTAYAIDTHTTESMDALYDYAVEHGYAYGMFQNTSIVAFNKEKMVAVCYQGQHLPVPGSCIYVQN